MSILRQFHHDFIKYRQLIRQLASRDLKSRYKVSVLGFFWSLLRPLLTILVLAAVFSQIIRFNSEIYQVSYWVILTIAYIPWFYFNLAFLEGTQALLANAHLVKKVYCPRTVYPTAVVLSNLINFLLSLLVLLPLVYLYTGITPGWTFLWLPVVIAFQTLFLLGLCLFTSILNVLYRDTTQIAEFLIFVWFYLSPVLYDVNMVNKELSTTATWIYLLNPMAGIIEAYRYVLLSPVMNNHPWYTTLVLQTAIPYAFIISVFIFFLGYGMLKRWETRAVDEM